jgi:hypothetical protein
MMLLSSAGYLINGLEHLTQRVFLHHTHNKGVCHTGALPFILKKYHEAKEKLWKLKYFTMKKCNLQKVL